MKSWLLLILTLLSSSLSFAQSKLKEDLKALGAKEPVLDLATQLEGDVKSRVVQKRLVSRENRIELLTMGGQRFGGDSYLETRTLGVGIQYHLNPRFSFGVTYQDFGSSLSVQGERAFREAREAFAAGGGLSSYPEIDPPQSLVMAQTYFYPIYGKLNFFDMSVVQFDAHVNLGLGRMQLSQSDSEYASLGTGVGVWINKNLSLRGDVRLEYYRDYDSIYQTRRTLTPTLISLGLGVLL